MSGSDTQPTGAYRPILVLGISRRSGTNFLASLLQFHPDCTEPGRPLLEDHLLRDADLLLEYVERTSTRWAERWGDRNDTKTSLEHHLADALAGFLSERDATGRVVSKTPSADNLSTLTRLRPPVDAVVLLRDGRSVTSSLVSGFKWSFRKAALEWRRGARAILEFQQLPEGERSPLRVTVVRYEDVIADFDAQVRALLEFLALDPDRFDWDAARNSPIIGSSFVRTRDGRLTWEPVERNEQFDPTTRFADWSSARAARFRALAGPEQRALDYDEPPAPSPGAAWHVYNVLADACGPLVRIRDEAAGRYLERKGRRRSGA